MSTNSLGYEHAELQTRLLRDILQELRDQREERRAESSRSSVQLEQDSKGVIKPTVKVYDGSPSDELAERAWDTFVRAKVRALSMAEDASLETWRQTLEGLNAARRDGLPF